MRSRLFAMLLALAISSLNSAWPKESRQSWEDATLKSLTLREKIGQLIHIRIPGKFLNRQSAEFLALQDAIKKNKVGGVVLFAGDIYESAVLINDLQTASKLPLIVSSDFERGAAFRIADTTSFPWTMAIGATGSEEFAYQQGYITAKESRAMGVHWLFAPVVDVNNNLDLSDDPIFTPLEIENDDNVKWDSLITKNTILFKSKPFCKLGKKATKI